MMGVPLAIVDQNKLEKLVKKLFNAGDTGAEFEMDVRPEESERKSQHHGQD